MRRSGALPPLAAAPGTIQIIGGRMFADPVSSLMLIILLFFAGLLVMFIFILRSLELASQGREETRRQLSISLTDLERKVAELTFALREKGLVDIETPPCEAPPLELAEQNLDDLASLFDRLSGQDAKPGADPAKPGDERRG